MNLSDHTDVWALRFEDWLFETVHAGMFEYLIRSDRLPDEFQMAHPTSEHFLPLIIAWATADTKLAGKCIHRSFSYGNLGLSCYNF